MIWSKRKKRILFAAFTVIAVFLLIEIICRVLSLPDTILVTYHGKRVDGDAGHVFNVEDPFLMWRPRPNYNSHFHINSDGLRDREFDRKKPPGTFRVFCLGDSTTFGINLDDVNGGYHKMLERKLMDAAKPGQTFEVINGGVTGYTAMQGLAMYRRVGRKYSPDVVTAYFGINDANRYYHLDDRQILATGGEISKGLQKGVLYHSALYKTLRGLVLKSREPEEKKKVPRVSLEDFPQILLELNREVVADGGTLVLIATPVCPPNYNEDGVARAAKYRQKVIETAKNNDLPLLFVPELTEIAPFENIADYFGDGVHLNERGHAYLANRLYDLLRARHLLPD